MSKLDRMVLVTQWQLFIVPCSQFFFFLPSYCLTITSLIQKGNTGHVMDFFFQSSLTKVCETDHLIASIAGERSETEASNKAGSRREMGDTKNCEVTGGIYPRAG